MAAISSWWATFGSSIKRWWLYQCISWRKNKVIMKIEDLLNKYPVSFHLSNINDSCIWEKNKIDLGRCSVFSKSFTTYQELVENIDNIDSNIRALYRERFYHFLLDIIQTTIVYKIIGSSKHINIVNTISIDDVILLTEKCGMNIFIPDWQVVFIGHDDYGFILLSDSCNQNLDIITDLLSKHSLFLLRTQN